VFLCDFNQNDRDDSERNDLEEIKKVALEGDLEWEFFFALSNNNDIKGAFTQGVAEDRFREREIEDPDGDFGEHAGIYIEFELPAPIPPFGDVSTQIAVYHDDCEVQQIVQEGSPASSGENRVVRDVIFKILFVFHDDFRVRANGPELSCSMTNLINLLPELRSRIGGAGL
jgi:hypothetical protein